MTASIDTQLSSIRSRLSKKQSFEPAIADAITLTATQKLSDADQTALFDFAVRCFTLLKSRYTTIPFWRAGQRLFEHGLAACGAIEQQKKLQQYVVEARDHVAAADNAVDRSTAAPPPRDFLFEGQLCQGEPPPQPLGIADILSMTASIAADDDDELSPPRSPLAQHGTGNVADARDQAAADGNHDQDHIGTHPSATTAAADGDAAATQSPRRARDATARAAASPGDARRRRRRVLLHDMQRQIYEALASVESGMAAVTNGTQRVERELEHLSAWFNRNNAPRHDDIPKPPASKRVIANLQRRTISSDAVPPDQAAACHGATVAEESSNGVEDKVKNSNDGAAVMSGCAICMDGFIADDVVVTLPCGHEYHDECVLTWLRQHNSCPTCRHELPTDDVRYEVRKERALEEEAERVGAANALSHNEFMFI